MDYMGLWKLLQDAVAKCEPLKTVVESKVLKQILEVKVTEAQAQKEAIQRREVKKKVHTTKHAAQRERGKAKAHAKPASQAPERLLSEARQCKWQIQRQEAKGGAEAELEAVQVDSEEEGGGWEEQQREPVVAVPHVEEVEEIIEPTPHPSTPPRPQEPQKFPTPRHDTPPSGQGCSSAPKVLAPQGGGGGGDATTHAEDLPAPPVDPKPRWAATFPAATEPRSPAPAPTPHPPAGAQTPAQSPARAPPQQPPAARITLLTGPANLPCCPFPCTHRPMK